MKPFRSSCSKGPKRSNIVGTAGASRSPAPYPGRYESRFSSKSDLEPDPKANRPNRRKQRTAFESDNGRLALTGGTGLHAPKPTLAETRDRLSRWGAEIAYELVPAKM
jgi:hypothetical protein